MRLWLLRPFQGHPRWNPWYDKAFGFVVRAETAQDARMLVAKAKVPDDPIEDNRPGDEDGYRWDDEWTWETSAWLDPTASTCVELTADGAPEVIIRDFASA